MPEDDDIEARALRAAKWSMLTEVMARLIAPATQMILARYLAPSAFGVVAAAIMVTTFAEMLSDSGFQKFLVQRPIADRAALERYANVAFWVSMVLSLSLLVSIAFFRDAIATAVGVPGLGLVLVAASSSLPLAVVSGTQQALFRRAFEYKRVLPIRVGSSLLTLVVAVPLAVLGYGYWALIFGMLASALMTAVLLTIASPWKPVLFFSWPALREMFSFSAWSLMESVAIWATTWVGTLIVSRALGQHELGLYQQPIIIVNAVFAFVTSATTPILFAALSRLQSDAPAFEAFFLKFQFFVALLVLPLGIGGFFFRAFLTEVGLGPGWAEASLMVGVWSASTSVMIVFSHYCSEVYRSLGRPRVSLLAQLLYLFILTPTLYFSVEQGFEALVVMSGLVRLAAIAINQIFLFVVAGISFSRILHNLAIPLLATVLMGFLAFWLAPVAHQRGLAASAVAILLCFLVYSGTLLLFPKVRRAIRQALPTRARRRVSMDLLD